jgi:D-amino-acid dehydrogenase|uniref:Putative D-amino acid dehydrogenase n=1 Tax=Agrobacterium sp. IP I-671 TaxID=173261 RepID=Q8VT64_9HYPH|nr:putative D-amino acid dehydrogenase [Agrobacterium sp. IP I-671]
MRVVVLGAGVVGIATAWYLSKAGHDVTVIDREPAAGFGTSYGNAGQISPALSSPWAFPGLVKKAVHWAFAEYPPLIVGRVPDAAMARFLWRMWRASSVDQYVTAKRAMVTLAEYSRDCFRALRREIPIDYAGRQRGLLVAFRSPEQSDGYARDLAVLDELRVPYRRLSREEVAEVEPNIAPTSGVIGGVQLETDESGDCFRFTQALAARCAENGVRFVYGHAASALLMENGRIKAVRTAEADVEMDAVVVALGVWSNALLKPLGIDLPIYPVKGYSLTVKADPDTFGPMATISDETYKVGVTNLGDRIRVGGTAELAGFDVSQPEKRYAGLYQTLKSLFPKVPEAAIADAERWSGLRPVTPDGPPLIGRSRIPNLYINSGHGTLGWTMSCGSGRLLADVIGDERPAVSLSRFAPTAL